MNVRLDAGQFGWDYWLVFEDGTQYLVQIDTEYPEVAKVIGWTKTAADFANHADHVRAASEFLDANLGDNFDIDENHPLHQAAMGRQETAPVSDGLSPEPAPAFVPITEMDAGFSIEVIQEDQSLPVDEERADKETLRAIRRRLARGDSWAWGIVGVFARWAGHVGKAYLHGCSYQSEQDFIQNSGYYADMKSEALADLNRKIQAEFDRQHATQRQQPRTRMHRASLTAPLDITSTSGGMLVKHDGSLDLDEIKSLLARPEYNALGELFENAISNGILEWIDPAEINALTDAPMLAKSIDVQRDPNDNSLTRRDDVYIDNYYQIRTLLSAIFSREKGLFSTGRQSILGLALGWKR